MKAFSMLVLLSMVTLTVKAADYVPKLWAGVVKADSWTTTTHKEGVYQLEVKDGGSLTQLSTGDDVYMAPLGGAVYVDGTMKGIHFKTEYDPYTEGNSYTVYHVEYDMQTWKRTKAVTMDQTYANLISTCGIAHDPLSGKDYGIFYNFNFDMQVINRKLATIDFSKDKPTKDIIDVVTTPFAAIAFAPSGALYGVGMDGFLYAIDPDDAELMPLGDLGIEDISTYPSTMAFDPQTGKLYWSYVNTAMKSCLYEVNYAIGHVSATKVMDVPDNAFLVNMYFPAAVAGAPTAATGLSLSFEGEKTTGTVSFTMPSKDQQGETLSGAQTYTIYAGETELYTGTAEAGAAVSRTVTVPESGDTEIRVVVKNDKGESPAVKTTQYIGRDTPLAVTDLTLSYNASTGKALLTWTAPTQGTHGKPLTPANLTYQVVRQPGNVTVATATRETSFSEPLPNTGDLKGYSYTVTPVNGELTGAAATSNILVLGDALELPFTENFSTVAGFNRFTVIDANNDGAKWERFYKYYSYSGTEVSAASIVANRDNADDDYLLTPQLRMERGSRYALTFQAHKSYSPANYDQKMEVLFGQGDDPKTYTKVAIVDIDDVNEMNFEYELIPTSDGIFRVAFHAISKANSDQLLLDNIKIAAPLAGTAPEAVTNLKITAGEKGALTATVTMTAPSKNVRGEMLTAITKIDVVDADGKVVGTIANPEPGKTCTIECTGLKNGYNTLSAIPYVGTDAGSKTSAEAFIGVDRPVAPSDITLSDDGTNAILTWTAPTEGFFGHYVNPDALKYNLYTIGDDGYADPYVDDIQQPYNTGVKTNEGDQQLLYYALCAESAAGEGGIDASNSLVIGAPYPMPFAETFSQGLHTNQFVWFEGEEFSRNFKIVSESADDDNAALAFYPNYAKLGIFSTGKVSIQGAQKPVFTFQHYAQAGELAALVVYVDRLPQNVPAEVAQFDYSTETESGWKKVTVDLAPFTDSPYVILRFAFVSNSYEPIIIDDIRVEEATATTLSAVDANALRHQAPAYNLAGQRVGSQYRGIVIQNGKKMIRK